MFLYLPLCLSFILTLFSFKFFNSSQGTYLCHWASQLKPAPSLPQLNVTQSSETSPTHRRRRHHPV